MIVMKFGGTSVGSAKSILNVKKIVESAQKPIIVVVSALGGITDKLIQILENYQILKQDFEMEITENIQLETNSMIHETIAKIS